MPISLLKCVESLFDLYNGFFMASRPIMRKPDFRGPN